jgi:hypothetical protein
MQTYGDSITFMEASGDGGAFNCLYRAPARRYESGYIFSDSVRNVAFLEQLAG